MTLVVALPNPFDPHLLTIQPIPSSRLNPHTSFSLTPPLANIHPRMHRQEP